MPDTLQVITIPAYDASDTLVNTDLDQALQARYSTEGIDLTALHTAVPPRKPSWRDGIEGTPKAVNIGDNSGILALITGMFVLMMLSYRHCRRLFSTLFRELLGMRRRANVFDERTTNETRVIALMAVQWSVYTGMLLFTFMSGRVSIPPERAFIDVLLIIALTGAYYVFQLCAYSTVGYAFATPSGRKYFVQGFTASQSLLGFALMVPALVAIFYPSTAPAMIDLAVMLYVIARIIFITKGFRIFYHKIESLLYFILYLCTLEIIPLIVIYKTALLLVDSL